MEEHFCKCPYVLCRVHGNCRACIAKNLKDGTLCYCMEAISEKEGAKLPVNIPRTEIYDTEAEMSVRCARIVQETLKEKPDALLCFPAGMSVVGTCEELVKMQKAGEADFSRAKFVSLDEWLDLEDETENCSNFLRRHLYEPLGIREDQMALFDTHAQDLEEECRRIDAFVFENGHIDLMLLGIGMNGHLGLNEPGDNFDAYAKVVELSQTTREVGQKYFSNGMKLTRGITLGIRHILETKKVILQIAGSHKQDIVWKLYHTRPTQELPATALMLMDGAEVIMDREAAAKVLELVGERKG